MPTFTNIEWCDTTVNPTTGCPGCEILKNCYAHLLHVRRLALALPKLYAPDFTEVRLAPGRMVKAASLSDLSGCEHASKPWFFGRPRHIFISDMSDALAAAVPFDYLKTEIIDIVASKAGKRHIWLWLTKRPERMVEFDHWLAAQGIAWPKTLWAGTSVTSQPFANKRVPSLLAVRASVHFLSVEPMLGSVDLTAIRSNDGRMSSCLSASAGSPNVRWVICGGESGAGARAMQPDWARTIRDQCREAGVAFFFKQWGGVDKTAAGRLLDGVAWNELPTIPA